FLVNILLHSGKFSRPFTYHLVPILKAYQIDNWKSCLSVLALILVFIHSSKSVQLETKLILDIF
uniref:hypothetical protein n=1 Tax=Nostoc sp. CCY 9925 TaxID=3103865 RepID=UPI0039C65543